jgi:hypothetical protein
LGVEVWSENQLFNQIATPVDTKKTLFDYDQ